MASLNPTLFERFIPARSMAEALLAATLLMPAAAHASSIVRQGPETAARNSLVVVDAGQTAPGRVDPAACAAAFHAHFAAIKAGPFAALKEAGAADPAAADAMLPGQLLFAPSPRPRAEAENSALRSAVALARRQGRTVQPADANARWIAARIREDLSDFLSQGPSPYLCGGIDEYLATMKRYADQIGTSPDRRELDLATQRDATARSLAAALKALRPVAVPTAAPADRPDPTAVAETLRSSVGLRDGQTMGPPMLLADRQDGQTKISEGHFDPDLPPLSRKPPLNDEASILAAIDSVLVAAETYGHVAAPLPQVDEITTGSVGTSVAGRPVIERLKVLRPALIGPAPTVRDPQARLAMVAALSDIEALDYLRLAANEPADPLGAAFAATFDAIAAAHAEACRCKP